MLPPEVANYLESNRQPMLEKLFELLRIPSVTNNDDPYCQEAAEWLAAHLKKLGLHAEVFPTSGKPNVLAEWHVSDEAPTLLIYGHYDVQPPDPLKLWESPPFEPQVRDGWIYARGANDDKGQLFTHLMAIEAWQHAGGGVPINLKVFFEGEEEGGSPNLEPFLLAHKDRLSADAAVISDSAFFADGIASITYALRGLVYVEITLHGPNRDVHSGLYGGVLANPLNALTKIVAGMTDESGRITLPGFYDDVLELTEEEHQSWEHLPVDEREWMKDLGVSALSGGEKGFSVLERNWARPTLDVNGIVGGYTKKGSKTIIPAKAHVKISTRLVPNQNPDKIVESFRKYLTEHTPAGMRAEFQIHSEARPVLLETHSPAMQAATDAITEAFGQAPAFIRCGASVPVTELIQRLLGLDAVLMGFGLPEDRLHSPNERFRLDQLYRGAAASAAFMWNLSKKSS